VYVHRLVAGIGTAIAVLGGLDALVFTGGVGERAAPVRRALADRLGWIGVAITDDAPSVSETAELTVSGARVRTFVVHAREDLQMAAEVRELADRLS
jgi:acetate kinase